MAENSDTNGTDGVFEVNITRQVKISTFIILGMTLGAFVGLIISFIFPVSSSATYTLAQVIAFMVVVCGALGVLLGAVIALIVIRFINRSSKAYARKI